MNSFRVGQIEDVEPAEALLRGHEIYLSVRFEQEALRVVCRFFIFIFVFFGMYERMYQSV